MPPRLQHRLLPFRPASFSTTSQLCALPGVKKSKPAPNAPKVARRTLKLSNKNYLKDPKPPAPGERKAFRKRLVLSNTNAINAGSLPNLARNVQTQSGQVVAIPGAVVDSLRICGAFKVSQGWSNYQQPSFLVRDETIKLAELMDEASHSSTARILHGERKAGKSATLLQAMAMAFHRDWIVVNIPECRDLIDAHTDYTPVSDSQPMQFIQKTQTARLLSRIAEANQPVLAKLNLSTTHKLPISYDPSLNLHQLAMLGASTPDVAWPIFTALWTELTLDGRPPVLLAADNISHLFVPSHYQILEDGKLKAVHPFDLLLARFFIDYLTHAKTLPNCGLTLGATSMSDQVPCRPLEIGINLAVARESDPTAEVSKFWNKLERMDERVLERLLDLRLLTVGRIPKTQTRTLIEYWAMNGLVRDLISPSYVAEKWTLSGGGILGELESGLISGSLRI